MFQALPVANVRKTARFEYPTEKDVGNTTPPPPWVGQPPLNLSKTSTGVGGWCSAIFGRLLTIHVTAHVVLGPLHPIFNNNPIWTIRSDLKRRNFTNTTV